MTLKTCRLLQIIALSLFVITLLIILIGTLAQGPLLRLFRYTYNSGMLSTRVFPISIFLRVLFHVILAGIFLFLLFGHPSRGTMKGTIIALAAILCLIDIAIDPLLSRLATNIISRKGSMSLASYSMLNSALSSITCFFYSPARILMLLSMGASLQLDLTPISTVQPPFVPPYNNPYPPYPYQ